MGVEKDPDMLGIFVTSPVYIEELYKIVQACLRAGKKVKVFFTYKATHLVLHPTFQKLREMLPIENLAICLAALRCEGFEPGYFNNFGLSEKQLRTQAFHGEILEGCGKYLVL